jgi:ABC-2 type transport system ATP-binding protein
MKQVPTVILRAEGLTKRYGRLTAVNGLNLEVRRGEVFGFLGPNGAGKTTSIHMLCGLLQPDAGQVWLDGQALTVGAARRKVGLCPQQAALWERLTCLEQLQFIGQMYNLPGRTARQRGEQLLADLGLSAQRDQTARTLSGGMQRRLNLAMALVHDPEIVVLDEPEAGLDPQSRVKVREFIQMLAQDKTVILTTHNMDEAERLADRVAIIDHGALLVVDTPRALKARLGEGDVLEIELEASADQRAAVQSALAQGCAGLAVAIEADRLSIRGLDLIGRLPAILETLAAVGVAPREARLRPNTLEDVFIELTGRKLRE